MTDPEQNPATSSVQWFRPAFWLGIAFNALACVPALMLLAEPTGSEQMEDPIIGVTQMFSRFAAVLALFGGVPVAIVQGGRYRKCGGSAGWEIVGLLLCFTPAFTGWEATQLMLQVKGFRLLY